MGPRHPSSMIQLSCSYHFKAAAIKYAAPPLSTITPLRLANGFKSCSDFISVNRTPVSSGSTFWGEEFSTWFASSGKKTASEIRLPVRKVKTKRSFVATASAFQSNGNGLGNALLAAANSGSHAADFFARAG